ncbi:MAG: Hsp20/alpha crystallin family protein [Saprospiraceae bacterium]|nr:Hsp20/alpha crystallin family protein [Saprospiraceae bacterium]
MPIIKSKRKGGLTPAFNSFVENFFRDDDIIARWKESHRVPPVNVEETDDQFIMSLAAPGLKKEDFNIEVNNGMIVVGSEQSDKSEEKGDNFTRKEFSYSSFKRSFWLPENCMPENIIATYEDGVLKVTVPKEEAKAIEAPKKIKVG